MQKYLIHVASSGDRWDSLSYQYYGDATAYNQIIIANPHIGITTTLNAGDTIAIPIIAPPKNSVNDVPPWLQENNDD